MYNIIIRIFNLINIFILFLFIKLIICLFFTFSFFSLKNLFKNHFIILDFLEIKKNLIFLKEFFFLRINIYLTIKNNNY
jgi:hypothetical protein